MVCNPVSEGLDFRLSPPTEPETRRTALQGRGTTRGHLAGTSYRLPSQWHGAGCATSQTFGPRHPCAPPHVCMCNPCTSGLREQCIKISFKGNWCLSTYNWIRKDTLLLSAAVPSSSVHQFWCRCTLFILKTPAVVKEGCQGEMQLFPKVQFFN